MKNALVSGASLFVAAVHGAVVDKRASSGTATVNLAVPQGTPSHLASGFIYGIPDTPNQIPDQFYTDMGFRYTRAGGAQIPARGWAFGKDEFEQRFDSSLSNYKTARKYGARVQLLLADLWGADATIRLAMPGANGDWSSFDEFLDTVLARIDENDMIEGLDLEIWNEPDGPGFWQSSQAQYLEMWGRAFPKIRAAFPDMPIVGPSSAGQPSTSNRWAKRFYQFIKTNGSVPDYYTWHEETSGDEVTRDVRNLENLIADVGLPRKPFMINEYAVRSEQNPATAAWYISRLERHNVIGLRGHWASGYSLHDYFANLLSKPGATDKCRSNSCATSTGYWGNGEYNVYKYYNLNMTGSRVQTSGSSDTLFDVYATSNGKSRSAKILCGTRHHASTWSVQIMNLDKAGYPKNGKVKIQKYQFGFGNGKFDRVSVVDLGLQEYTSKNNQLTFDVTTNNIAAYAFELI
ncbi:uncharacterized protein FMAN_14388 [Fusarium mangiferae]|uniref:Beta-xylosidase n=1 Tax=Fusarium mangiferae TaxID=192010 RepID=A0A1L7UGJ0_FUSMA|nr:uncharacterized protein FMAN_14388 [Fusarium mangiferae]CVL07483.1 uncharacterized protein FMAN_14388 [Fusarium mangiferae]